VNAPPFSPDWAFFLDVDGTLIDIATKPDAVRVTEEHRSLLRALQDATQGAVALVSGRPVDGIDALFAPLTLPAAGQHGIERRDASGRVHHFPVRQEALRATAPQLLAFAGTHPGIVLEDKGASLALHYRQAPHLAGEVEALMNALCAQLGRGVEVQHGKMVVELKPAGRNKGTAVEEFMRESPFAGRTPVFIGDDLTDEHGFVAVNRLGGHSAKVGDGSTNAQWHFSSTAAVRAWLKAFVDAARG
jgi:trehalose 6-phosphate phosphatase